MDGETNGRVQGIKLPAMEMALQCSTLYRYSEVMGAYTTVINLTRPESLSLGRV